MFQSLIGKIIDIMKKNYRQDHPSFQSLIGKIIVDYFTT